MTAAGAPAFDVRWWRRPVVTPLVVGLLAAVLLCGVALVAAHGATSSVESEALRRVRSNTDAASREVVRESQDYTRTVTTWAAEPGLMTALQDPVGNPGAAQTALSTLARSKDSPAAFVTDVHGRIVAIYPSQPDLLGQDYSYRDWFRGVSRTRAPYVSSAYQSASNGHPQVAAVAAPVVAAGRPVGYVVVLWPLDSVRAVADGARQDDGVKLTVTDQRGLVLTDAVTVDARGEARVGTVDSLTRQALQGRSVSTTRSGSLVAARPVSELGWTVTASLPSNRALASAREFVRSLLLTLGFALLLVLVYSVLAVVAVRRRLAGQALAEGERRRLAALFAGSPIGILEGLPDGTILAVNQALADMLGYPVDELLATRFADLAHADSVPFVPAALRGVLEGSLSSYTEEQIYRARDGSPVPSLVSVMVLREPGGALKRLFAFVVDQRQQKADADALRQLAEVLAEREAFLATLFDTMDVGVLACDSRGAITRINSHLRTLHGLAPGAPVDAMSSLHLAHLDGSPMAPTETPLQRALSHEDVPDTELLILPQDGPPPVRVIGRARRLKGLDGETVGAVVAVHDVTAIRAAEGALRASEERFRRVFDEGLTGKALVDQHGRIERANATLGRLLQRPPEYLVGRSLAACFRDPVDQARVHELVAAQDGELSGEMAILDAEDRLLWALVALVWIPEDGGRRVLLAQIEDITARRRAEQQLTELALHDDLTDLPNRRLLLERCEQAFAIARSRRGPTTVAVLFLDLDGFKNVNDRAGHEVGDQLLAAVAHDLQGTLRPSDTVARVGGDEFVVLLDRYEGLSHLRDLADRVGTTIRRQVAVEGSLLSVSASIGIARVDVAVESDVGPDLLLRRADAAMYRAKERGRDRHDLFDTDLRDRTEARRVLEDAVRDGVARDRVSLVFQPIVDIDSGTVVGAEALMRLTNSQGRLLPTLAAVIAAENAGLADLLGERVLDLALGAVRTWPEHMTVAVNVSAREITGRDFRSRVEDGLQRHDVDPARLVLEITESSILHAGPSALRELDRLRGLGVRVAIDDFGTAYATLQNLTTLPVDALKVDASFTAGLPDEKVHTAVVHGIASMAFEMDVPCIVEGIETAAQLRALRGMSVQGQGWLWGQPLGSGQLPTARLIPSVNAPAD